jgi:hypothetical protein
MNLASQTNPPAQGAQTYQPSSLRAFVQAQWPELLAIGLFAAAVAYATPSHEPWADEAQAWQLARSLPLGVMFQHYLRYEGSPGLWHLLLWIMIRLHITYTGMHWIAGAIAVAATGVLVLKSPFPRYLKLTLPFTFFLVYQYAVVARNYVLVPPLLFLIATWWKKRPLGLAIALGLLANVSLHAAVISGGLALAFLIERLKAKDWRKSKGRRKLLESAFVVASFFAIAIWTAWPPKDIGLHVAAMHLNAPPAVSLILASFLLPVCQPFLLAFALWITIVAALHARHSLLLLLPVILFVLFNGVVVGNFWHFGLIIPLLLAIVWISWPPPFAQPTRREPLGHIALFTMAIVQIAWSAYAIRYDHTQNFSPDLAASRMLRPLVDRGASIIVTSMDQPDEYVSTAIGILPYFDRNIFQNLPQPFYQWNDQNPMHTLYRDELLTHPSIVLVEAQQSHLAPNFNLNHPRIHELTNLGYKLTNVFCGAMPFRTAAQPTYCHLIFQSSQGAR